MKTIQFKLLPSRAQEIMLNKSTQEYIGAINALVDYILAQVEYPRLSSASFRAELPSSVKSEVVLNAQFIVKKARKGTCHSIPILRKPVVTWNNQNYKVCESSIEFPLWINGKSKRISVQAIITPFQREQLHVKLGTLRVTQKRGKWIAQIAVHDVPNEAQSGGVMGIDLGLKVPAVCVTDKGNTKFFGNGRENKYMRRKYKAKRKALGKAKKPEAIRCHKDKEHRWMKDQDHKISRGIINYAQAQGISTIRIEQLSGIRQTARTSRKNEHNLHTWSFYRLAQYVEYKAKVAGIRVEYVNPAYTSQTCPVCGKRNHAKDRKYVCDCGYTAHRDRIGAMNIIKAPMASGKRTPA